MTYSLQLKVLTPQHTVVETPVDAVIAPLPDGWIGVLPGHPPFQARLMPGEIAFRGGGQRRRVATRGGLLNVDDGWVRILTGAAAVDTDFATLEQEFGEGIARARALEQEVEKRFSEVYRAVADTLNQRRERRIYG